MKLKLKDLNSNPFKKEINGGKLDKEQVKIIKSNINELGLMGSLPVFKRDNKYFLVAGHHRVQALKEVYGNNFQIEVTIHNYNDDQIMRGMVVENLTQRAGDFREEVENLVMIRKYLKKNSACSNSEQANKKDMKGIQEAGSIRQIANWLNKNGEVMSIGKISEWLRVHDKLDKSILDEISFNKGHTHHEEGKISIEDAKNIARIENKEHQKKMKNLIVDAPLNYKQKSEIISKFNQSTEKVKEAILKKPDINLVDFHKIETRNIDLNREKLHLENHIELREKLSALFKEKLFLKKSSASELEITYHYLLNWIRKDLIPFMKAIEEELKNRGKENEIVFYDFERRKN